MPINLTTFVGNQETGRDNGNILFFSDDEGDDLQIDDVTEYNELTHHNPPNFDLDSSEPYLTHAVCCQRHSLTTADMGSVADNGSVAMQSRDELFETVNNETCDMENSALPVETVGMINVDVLAPDLNNIAKLG